MVALGFLGIIYLMFKCDAWGWGLALVCAFVIIQLKDWGLL